MTDLFSRTTTRTDEWPFSDEEDDMPLAPNYTLLADYLKNVFAYMYRVEKWFIASELAIYGPNRRVNPLAPDVAVFVGVPQQENYAFTSWYIGEGGNPPPRVVFEFASAKTWEEDFNKLPHYAAWGVAEVYIYELGNPRVWPRRMPEQLHGYHNEDGAMVEQQPDADRRIWSAALDSWLVPDGTKVRLTDKDGNRRLTDVEVRQQAEAEAQAERKGRLAEAKARRAAQKAREAEVQARQQAEAQAQAERAARAQAEAQAQTERQAYADLMAKLRAKDINPDSL